MFRTIFSIGLLQTGGIVITALRSKLFAVLLGPAGFGIVATIDQLVTSLAQLSNFSVPFTAMKFLSSSHSVGEDEFKKSYAAFLRLMLGLALVATVASVAMTTVVRCCASCGSIRSSTHSTIATLATVATSARPSIRRRNAA